MENEFQYRCFDNIDKIMPSIKITKIEPGLKLFSRRAVKRFSDYGPVK